MCGFFGGGDGNDNDVKFECGNALVRSYGAKVWINEGLYSLHGFQGVRQH